MIATPTRPPRLGPYELRSRFALSPMAEFTSWPLRLLAQEFGAAFACTEMVKAHFVAQRHPETLQILACHPDEKLCGGQICGGEEAPLRAAVRILIEELGFPFVDFNLACPIKRVVSSGAGGGLLMHPEKVRTLVSAMVEEAAPKPVTVKLRSGLDQDNITAVEIAQAAEAGGAAMIALHPRTVRQGYGGQADHQVIKDVAERISVPVVGGGDIHSAEEAVALLSFSGCDLVYFARAAIGAPWIFERATMLLETNVCPPQSNQQQISRVFLKHVQLLAEHLGERRACLHARRLAREYAKSLPGSETQELFYRSFRTVENLEQLNALLKPTLA